MIIEHRQILLRLQSEKIAVIRESGYSCVVTKVATWRVSPAMLESCGCVACESEAEYRRLAEALYPNME